MAKKGSRKRKHTVGGLTIIPASIIPGKQVGGVVPFNAQAISQAPSFAPNVAPSAPQSAPIPGVPQPPPQMGGMDPLSNTIMMVNTNPYIIGMLMLLLNLGGRFLSLELTKKQEAFLQAPWIRPIIFFTVVFMATRNAVVAFWLTLALFFLIWVVANEHSPFCMIPEWCHKEHATEKANYLNNIKRFVGV